MNWLKFTSLIFLIGFSSNVSSQSKKIEPPKSYIAYKTQEAITIDGKADETIWKTIAWSSNFVDIEGVKKPKYQTKVKMLWDEDYYYILAQLEEPHVWGNLKQRDTIIYYNNNFEVFIDPDGDGHTYYELETNALNTVWDLFLTKPYSEENAVLNDWTATGLKSAISINGTLNNPTDIDESWTLEMAIPFKVFRESYFHDVIPRDVFWRVNFSRVNWDYDITNNTYSRKKDNNGKYLPEHNWVWSTQGVVNMHEPEKWGYVYFSSKESGTDVFTIPQDEKIKWMMYESFRKQKAYHSKHKKWITSLNKLQEDEIIINDKTITLVLENHKTGYNLTAISPFTKKELIITEDGKMTVN